MLNENKVKMMTKMAIYEKSQGRRMLKNARYYKSDYIALSVLKSTIVTTFAYIIIVLMYVLVIALLATVGYLVVKKAVKKAIIEAHDEIEARGEQG